MAVLNHAGVCLSYAATWNYLEQLIECIDYMGQLRQGHWLWIYDNFNIHQAIRHERQGKNLFFKQESFSTSYSL